jgi:hypothetical protein
MHHARVTASPGDVTRAGALVPGRQGGDDEWRTVAAIRKVGIDGSTGRSIRVACRDSETT